MADNGIVWDTPATADIQWDTPSSALPKKKEPPSDWQQIKDLLPKLPFGNAAETALTLGSGAIAGPVSGLAGIAGTMIPGPQGQGADWVNRVGNALSYEPSGKVAKNVQKAVAFPFEQLTKGADVAGSKTSDALVSALGPDVGGAVGPLIGSGVNTAIQALPLIAGRGVSATGSALRGEGLGAAGFMRRALTPSKTARETGQDVRAIDTALNDTGAPGPAGYNVTRGADAALTERIGTKMDQLDQAVANSGARASLEPIQQNLLSEYEQAMKDTSAHGEARRASVENAWNSFLNSPLIAGAPDIPIQDALAAKRQLNRYTEDRYGEQFSPQDVANARAVQSGLAESTSAASPTVAAINAEVSPLINLRNMIRDRVGVTGNRPIAGFGALAHTPTGVLAWLAERTPLVNSVVARALNTTGRGLETAGNAGLPLGMVMSQQAQEEIRRKRLAQLLGSK
jgi:hypothetical protein